MSSKIVLVFFLILGFLLITPKFVFAESWQYPLDKSTERASLKAFGQYFDKNSYIGKENLFPNQYTGFHAATDLEIFPEELNINVPVSAVGNGTILFIGPVSGYGGLILEKLDNLDLTALFGHLKLTENIKVGDHIQTGQTLAILGKEFSNETGGERKHLHFGIYKGHDLYFKGYENSKTQLDQKWINPMQFLKEKVATISPTNAPSLTPIITPPITQQKLNFFQNLWNWLKNMLSFKL